MVRRRVVEQKFTTSGIEYVAGDFAVTFLEALKADYARRLRERAAWVIGQFQSMPNDALTEYMRARWSQWGSEFALTYDDGEV